MSESQYRCVLWIPLNLRQPFIDWIQETAEKGCSSQAHVCRGGQFYFTLYFDSEKDARRFRLYAEFHGLVVHNSVDSIAPDIDIASSSYKSRLKD